jgi:hypothetical protein
MCDRLVYNLLIYLQCHRLASNIFMYLQYRRRSADTVTPVVKLRIMMKTIIPVVGYNMFIHITSRSISAQMRTKTLRTSHDLYADVTWPGRDTARVLASCEKTVLFLHVMSSHVRTTSPPLVVSWHVLTTSSYYVIYWPWSVAELTCIMCCAIYQAVIRENIVI